MSVLSGAPFGYRYVRKGPDNPARYVVVEHQARVVRELFRRYTEEPVSLRALGAWLTHEAIPTAIGRSRWDHQTVRQLFQNPAYCGRAAFGRTVQIDESTHMTRSRRLRNAKVSKQPARRNRARDQWIEIAVPAIVSNEVFELAARRLEDNRRFAARRTKEPFLLQGLIACRRCGYAYFRARKTDRGGREYRYYRCASSIFRDKRTHGQVCCNRPVRQDHLDALVWEHVTRMMSDPELIRRELARRLEEHRQGPMVTPQRSQLQIELNRTAATIKRLLVAYEADLVSLDELRRRMPELRKQDKRLTAEIQSLDDQLANEETYLKLAESLEAFLARLKDTATSAAVRERQQILRLVVREVLVDTDAIIVRHTIPGSDPGGSTTCHLWGNGHDPHPPMARWTLQDVHGEDPVHQFRPRVVSRGSAGISTALERSSPKARRRKPCSASSPALRRTDGTREPPSPDPG